MTPEQLALLEQITADAHDEVPLATTRVAHIRASALANRLQNLLRSVQETQNSRSEVPVGSR